VWFERALVSRKISGLQNLRSIEELNLRRNRIRDKDNSTIFSRLLKPLVSYFQS
jgi:hypothetical protein